MNVNDEKSEQLIENIHPSHLKLDSILKIIFKKTQLNQNFLSLSWI